MATTKVVILGGGFAGLSCAKSLGRTKLDVLLIDRTNHHLFQPLLYEIATATLSAADIATPIREALSRYQNISVMMGDVVSIDKKQHIVSLRHDEKIGFDYLVIALGGHSNYFGHDSWKKFAPGLKNLSDALKIREKILLAFEKAERSSSISEAKQYLNFVIVGGGPEGVEMAGAIGERACKSLFRHFRHIDASMVKIHLIEAGPTILPSFPKRLSEKAQQYLENFGVEIITNQKVTDVSEKGVLLGQTLIPCHNVFWTAGNQASVVLKSLDVPLDPQGRVIVHSDLSIPDHPEIFVIGDAAFVKEAHYPLPAIAPVAMQQGRYAAKRIMKKVHEPFCYRDRGMMTAIGKTQAIGFFKNWEFSGFFAWLAWAAIHIAYLPGIRNRLSVLMQWFFSFFTGKRAASLIYRSIDEE